MELSVFVLGPAPDDSIEPLQQALAQRGIPALAEPCPASTADITRTLAELQHDSRLLACVVQQPFKQTALAYCQELTHAAQVLGCVNLLARRASGLVYGDNTEVQAFAQSLREAGVKRVRTALVLGAGQAARIALCGLREMNCARYLVGFRNPRRPTELGSQLRSMRKQLGFFPIAEMEEFFSWAELSGVFEGRAPFMAPGVPDSTIKRWDLLVNATRVGEQDDDKALVSNQSFLRSFERVLDMVPREDGTVLTRAAEDAGVPALGGCRLHSMALDLLVDVIEREYKRRQLAAEGKLDPELEQGNFGRPGSANQPAGRVPVLRRRSR